MHIIKRFLNWIGIQHAFEKGLLARILVILALIYAVFGIIFVPLRIFMTLHPTLPDAHWTDMVIESLILIAGIVAIYLIRADNMRAASRVILASMLIAVTMQTYFLGGPANDISGSMGLLLFAILAILILDRVDRWVAVGLAVAIFVVLNIMAASGVLPSVVQLTPMGKTLFAIFVWIAISAIIAVILIAAMGAIRREPYLLDQQFSAPRASEENVTFLSTHDALTGLFNRLFFETEFSRLEKGRRFPISIISAEISGLLDINKEHGDKAGDQVILNAARLLAKALRPEDIIARYGGDEFAVILPTVDTDTAQIILARVQQQLTAYNTDHPAQPIHVSIGVSTAQQGESLRDHLARAQKHAIPQPT
ncbi:MAG: GGDEF domain-containing protein [Pelolinea sp.]|nr:GGDEF domain-containing protein [Pelolinea sp.]